MIYNENRLWTWSIISKHSLFVLYSISIGICIRQYTLFDDRLRYESIGVQFYCQDGIASQTTLYRYDRSWFYFNAIANDMCFVTNEFNVYYRRKKTLLHTLPNLMSDHKMNDDEQWVLWDFLCSLCFFSNGSSFSFLSEFRWRIESTRLSPISWCE